MAYKAERDKFYKQMQERQENFAKPRRKAIESYQEQVTALYDRMDKEKEEAEKAKQLAEEKALEAEMKAEAEEEKSE